MIRSNDEVLRVISVLFASQMQFTRDPFCFLFFFVLETCSFVRFPEWLLVMSFAELFSVIVFRCR